MRRRLLLIGAMLIGFACHAADFSASVLTGFQGGLGFKVSAPSPASRRVFPWRSNLVSATPASTR